MKSLLFLLLVAALAVNAAEAAAAPQIVYRSQFESGETQPWLQGRTSQTPGGKQLLGPYARQSGALLLLRDLPPHRVMRVRFTLVLIASVDGNSKEWGPDFWGLSLGGATELLRTTFSHKDGLQKYPQAFPDDYPAAHPAGTGVREIGAHGFRLARPDLGVLSTRADMTYELEVAFPHSDPEVELRFWSEFDSALPDEGWGLLKVEVEVAPEYIVRSDAELAALWGSLTGSDAMEAFSATWRLAESGPRALEFVRAQLGGVGGKERIAKLIADYRTKDVITREKARVALERLGRADATELRKALADPAIPKRVRDDLGEFVSELRAESPLFAPRIGRLLRAFQTAEADQLAAQFVEPAEKESSTFATLLWQGSHSHVGDSRVFGFSFAPDGRHAATGGGDGARLWDVETGGCVRFFPATGARSVALSPDGKLLAFGASASLALVWETATGTLQRQLVQKGEVWGLMFFPETNQLLTGAADGLRFWSMEDFTSGEPVAVELPVRSIARSPDGATLAVSESVWNAPRGLVTLRDSRTGEVKQTLARLNTSLTNIAFSPDGELLAVAQFNGEVLVYSVKTGEEKLRIKTMQPLGHGVIFSPDGQYLCAFGGSQHRPAPRAQVAMRLYRLSDGAEVWRTSAMIGCMNAAFSPDGKLLIATSSERKVYCWRIESPPAAAPAR